MDAVHVVVAQHVQVHVGGVAGHVRVARVEVVHAARPGFAIVAVHQPRLVWAGRRAARIERVVGRQRRRVVLPPDGQCRQPGVHLQALGALMGPIDQVLQGVEAGGQVRVFRARLETLHVVGIATTADLDKHRVQVGATRPGEQVVDLRGRLEAIVEGVDPDRAQFGRIHRLGLRRGRRRCDDLGRRRRRQRRTRRGHTRRDDCRSYDHRRRRRFGYCPRRAERAGREERQSKDGKTRW